MRRHQPSRYDLKAYEAALTEVANAPRITSNYLSELAAKRDQYLASLTK